MKLRMITNKMQYVNITSLPRLCRLRDDLYENTIPIVDFPQPHYCDDDEIHLSVWDAEGKFYFVKDGLLHQTESKYFKFNIEKEVTTKKKWRLFL